MIKTIKYQHTETDERKAPYEVLAAAYKVYASQEPLLTEQEFDALFYKPTLTYHLTSDGYGRFLAEIGRLDYAKPKSDDWYYGKHKLEDVTYMGASDFVEHHRIYIEKVYFILLDNSVILLQKVDEGYEVFIDTTPNPDLMIAPRIREAIALMRFVSYKNSNPSKYDTLIQKYIDYSKALL